MINLVSIYFRNWRTNLQDRAAQAGPGPWISLTPTLRLPEEILGLRLLFAYVLLMALPPETWTFPSVQPHPNGIAHWFDLTFMADPVLWSRLQHAGLVLIVLYALGIALPLVLPLLLALHLCIFTLSNSQGSIGHSMQLVTLVLLAQTVGYTLWPLYDLARRKLMKPTGSRSPLRSPDMALWFTTQTIAAAYVICGIAKLVNSEGRWIADIPNLAVQLHKTSMMDYYNDLQQVAAPVQDFMLRLLIDQPGLATVAFSFGLFLELGAILALLGRRWELLLGISVLMMHKVISEAMSLFFPFHMWVLFIFWVNVPFWLGYAVRRGWTTWRPRQVDAPAVESGLAPGK